MGFEWVADACLQLGRAKEEGKINQEILDYELAKITMEMIDEYRPIEKSIQPSKSVQFTALTKDDRKQLEESELKNLKEEHLSWLFDCQRVWEKNVSNLMWLKQCRAVFQKRGEIIPPKLNEIIGELNGKT